MRKIMLVCAAAPLALSCSMKYTPVPDPQVSASGRSSFVVSVDGLDGHLWTETALGVYGTRRGNNEMYVPRRSSIGTAAPAEFYGSAVDGAVWAYMPYSEEGCPQAADGCVLLGEYQKYCRDGRSQILSSTMLGGYADGDTLHLRNFLGAMHFRVSIEIDGEVKSITLRSRERKLCGNLPTSRDVPPVISDGLDHVTLRGMGEYSSYSTSLDVWFAIPEGVYNGFEISVASDAETISKPVSGTFSVVAGSVTDAVLEEEIHNYEDSDLDIIDGHFD